MNGPRIMIGMFFVTLIFAVVAWAITTDQIFNNVFDSANSALRVNQVAGS